MTDAVGVRTAEPGRKASASPQVEHEGEDPWASGGTATPLRKAAQHEPEVEFDVAPEFTEEGLALAFAEKHKNSLRYVKMWSAWMSFSGRHWQKEETLLAYDLIRTDCREAAKRVDDKNGRLKAELTRREPAARWKPSPDQTAAWPRPHHNGTATTDCSIRPVGSSTCGQERILAMTRADT